MVIWTRTATAVAAVIFLGGVAVHASESQSRPQGLAAAKRLTRELIVTSAAVDRDSETVTLRGFNFGARKPYVYCETQLMTVLTRHRRGDCGGVPGFPPRRRRDVSVHGDSQLGFTQPRRVLCDDDRRPGGREP